VVCSFGSIHNKPYFMGTISKLKILKFGRKQEYNQKKFLDIENGNFKKDYKLIQQIRAASGSVADNIGEEFERGSRLEFSNFLTISKGLVGEVKSQLYRALDRNYFSQDLFDEFYNKADVLTKTITSFINYLNCSDFKDQKFKNRK
jgi:four helix bundle protein